MRYHPTLLTCHPSNGYVKTKYRRPRKGKMFPLLNHARSRIVVYTSTNFRPQHLEYYSEQTARGFFRHATQHSRSTAAMTRTRRSRTRPSNSTRVPHHCTAAATHRRRGRAEENLAGPGLLDHPDDLPRGGAPNDGVVHEEHRPSPQHRRNRRQLLSDVLPPKGLSGHDESAADVSDWFRTGEWVQRLQFSVRVMGAIMWETSAAPTQ